MKNQDFELPKPPKLFSKLAIGMALFFGCFAIINFSISNWIMFYIDLFFLTMYVALSIWRYLKVKKSIVLHEEILRLRKILNLPTMTEEGNSIIITFNTSIKNE